MSDSLSNPDPHAPHVADLAAANDWAALARYWMAHQHPPALEAAIGVAETSSLPPALTQWLRRFAANPLDPENSPPDDLAESLSDQLDAHTVTVSSLFPQLALCEMAAQAPKEIRGPMLEAGKLACQMVGMIAEAIADEPLSAFVAVLRAGALREGHDLEAARDAFEEALNFYRDLEAKRPGVYTADVAMTQNNLGAVLSDLNELEAARDAFEEALNFCRDLEAKRPGVYTAQMAATQNNLGAVLRALNELEAARDAYEEALEIRRNLEAKRPGLYTADVANTQNNLGTVLSDLNELDAARDAYEEATGIYSQFRKTHPTAQLLEERGVYSNLGWLYRREDTMMGWPDYGKALQAFRQAREAHGRFRSCLHDKELRVTLGREGGMIYDGQVRTCIDLWDTEEPADPQYLREAAEAAEAGRARHLIDLLVDEDLHPRNLPPGKENLAGEFGKLRKHLRAVRAELERLETREGGAWIDSWRAPDADDRADENGGDDTGEDNGLPSKHAALSDEEAENAVPIPVEEGIPLAVRKQMAERQEEIERTEARQAEVLREIQQFDPEFDPDDPGAAAKLTDIQGILQNGTAAVQFTLTQGETIALIVTRDSIEPMRLEEVTLEVCRKWAESWVNDRNELIKRNGSNIGLAIWGESLPERLKPMTEHITAPLAAKLATGTKRLLLCPHRDLHLFPLHACGTGQGEELLCDRYEVSYVPSLSVYHRVVSRRMPERAGHALLIPNPTNDLHFSTAEAHAVAPLIGADNLPEPGDITTDWIVRNSKGCGTWYYTGHGMTSWRNPLTESALLLRSKLKEDKEDWFKLRYFFTELNLTDCFLAILNGCETNLINPTGMTDDFLSLSTGALFAGARCAVSTLWPVWDLSSALLMRRFAQLHFQDKLPPAAALREATRWLRQDITSGNQLAEEIMPKFLATMPEGEAKEKCRSQAEFHANTPYPPFAEPQYWAAFTANGAGFGC